MPRKNGVQSKIKTGDVQPVKDFDYNVNDTRSLALAKFANGGKDASSIINGISGSGYSRSDIEKNLITKGMTKKEAARQLEKNGGGGGFMDGNQMMELRQKEIQKMKERRDKDDLQIDQRDMYGAKNDKDVFEANDDDFFGGGGSDDDAMFNDPGYQKLANGMVVNDNKDDMKK